MKQTAETKESILRNEAHLIAAIQRGEKERFQELMVPYERAAYRMAFSVLRNDADAEDAVQEACIKAFRNLSLFRMESSFGTWLLSIVLNEARMRLRKTKRMPSDSIDELASDGAPMALLAGAKYDPARHLEQQQLLRVVGTAIRSLPLKYQQVFLLRAVHDFTIDESARALRISRVAVKVRLHRARHMIQKKLSIKRTTSRLSAGAAPTATLTSA